MIVVITALTVLLYYGVSIWLCRGLRFTARDLALGGLTCALTLVLASIMIPLPTGAVITCGSMLPLLLLSLLDDPRLAIVTGFLCGVLSMFLIPVWQPVHWAQLFVEHFICFSGLGYAGVFGTDKRSNMLFGMVVAIAIKFWGHVLSGVIFFATNAWDGWGAWAYSLTYHLTSKLPEGAATIAIVMLLPLSLLKRTLHVQKTKEGAR